MSGSCDILKEILKELKELNDRVLCRTNAIKLINDIDTSKTNERLIDMHKEFGVRKANFIEIVDAGGGFTWGKNGEAPKVSAINDYAVTDEDIYSLQIIGSGNAGTAVIRIGLYTPKE